MGISKSIYTMDSEAVTAQACGPTTIQHTSASLEVAGLKRSWIRHTRDWYISGNVEQGCVADSVARVAETPC